MSEPPRIIRHGNVASIINNLNTLEYKSGKTDAPPRIRSYNTLTGDHPSQKPVQDRPVSFPDKNHLHHQQESERVAREQSPFLRRDSMGSPVQTSQPVRKESISHKAFERVREMSTSPPAIAMPVPRIEVNPFTETAEAYITRKLTERWSPPGSATHSAVQSVNSHVDAPFVQDLLQNIDKILTEHTGSLKGVIADSKKLLHTREVSCYQHDSKSSDNEHEVARTTSTTSVPDLLAAIDRTADRLGLSLPDQHHRHPETTLSPLFFEDVSRIPSSAISPGFMSPVHSHAAPNRSLHRHHSHHNHHDTSPGLISPRSELPPPHLMALDAVKSQHSHHSLRAASPPRTEYAPHSPSTFHRSIHSQGEPSPRLVSPRINTTTTHSPILEPYHTLQHDRHNYQHDDNYDHEYASLTAPPGVQIGRISSIAQNNRISPLAQHHSTKRYDDTQLAPRNPSHSLEYGRLPSPAFVEHDRFAALANRATRNSIVESGLGSVDTSTFHPSRRASQEHTEREEEARRKESLLRKEAEKRRRESLFRAEEEIKRRDGFVRKELEDEREEIRRREEEITPRDNMVRMESGTEAIIKSKKRKGDEWMRQTEDDMRKEKGKFKRMSTLDKLKASKSTGSPYNDLQGKWGGVGVGVGKVGMGEKPALRKEVKDDGPVKPISKAGKRQTEKMVASLVSRQGRDKDKMGGWKI